VGEVGASDAYIFIAFPPELQVAQLAIGQSIRTAIQRDELVAGISLKGYMGVWTAYPILHPNWTQGIGNIPVTLPSSTGSIKIPVVVYSREGISEQILTITVV